jgi:hypothetical protein
VLLRRLTGRHSKRRCATASLGSACDAVQSRIYVGLREDFTRLESRDGRLGRSETSCSARTTMTSPQTVVKEEALVLGGYAEAPSISES